MALEDLFGSPDYLRQLIGEEQFDRAKQSALNQGIINASLQLLAGTPPSFDNRGATGRLLAQAGQAGLQGYQAGMDKTLSDIAKSMQVREMLAKQKSREAQQKALQVATTTMQPAVIPEGQTLRDDQGELTMGAEAPKAVPSTFNADIYKTYALRLGVDPKDISSTIEAMRGKTTTVKAGETILGEDMKPIYSAPREANLQSIDTPQGVMIFNPVTGGYTPARDASGQPIMGTQGKPPAKFDESVNNIKNLRTSIDSYINELKNTDPRYLFPGSSKSAELGTKFTDVQMRIKNLYELGAITGPDLTLLNQAITDPTSMAGRYKGKESLEKQANTINSILDQNTINLYETYRQPVPKDLKRETKVTPENVGLTLPQGVTVKRVK